MEKYKELYECNDKYVTYVRGPALYDGTFTFLRVSSNYKNVGWEIVRQIQICGVATFDATYDIFYMPFMHRLHSYLNFDLFMSLI